MSEQQVEFVFQLIGAKTGQRCLDMTGTMPQISELCFKALQRSDDLIGADDYVLIIGTVEHDQMKICQIPLFTVGSLLELHKGADWRELIYGSHNDRDEDAQYTTGAETPLLDDVPAQSSTPEPLLDIQNRI